MARMTKVREAIAKAGGPARVARMCGVTVQAACFWRDGLRALPFEHGPTRERASGVSRAELWPDDWRRVWPELANDAA